MTMLHLRGAVAGWRQTHPATPTVPQFFVSTTGVSGNAGSQASPWDWSSVIGGSHAQLNKPANGAIVYLRGGTYPGGWAVGANLCGLNPNGPFDPTGKIHIKAYPGEQVILTDSMLVDTTAGTDIWWWDIDFQNTDVNSSDIQGINLKSARHVFVFCTSHDHSGDGFGAWDEAPDSALVQCFTYYNGFTGTTPGSSFGHGFYIENQTGYKRLYGCGGLNNFGYNFHFYGSGAAFLVNGDFRSCGACAPSRGIPGNSGYNFLLGGGPPLINLNADSLWSMSPTAAAESTCASIGYFSDQTVNTTASVTNCLFDGKVLAEWWDSPAVLTFTGNRLGADFVVDLLGAAASLDAATVMDHNTYLYNGAFDPWALGKNQVYTTAATIAAWRTLVGGGREANSTYTATANVGQQVLVYPNPLAPGNAYVAIKNSAGASTVSVDVSGILTPGTPYNVYHQHSLRSNPVLTGTYGGGSLSFPMNPAIAPPTMLGGTLRSATPVDTRPYAGQFWVRS